MRSLATFSCLVLALATTGCSGDSLPETPTEPTPVLVTQSFADSLNPNGLRVHPFTVTRAGTVSAQIKVLSDETVTVGLSLGTWNSTACQIVIANPAALLNTTIVGTAQATGQFCVMLNDVGKLVAPVDYTVDVSYY